MKRHFEFIDDCSSRKHFQSNPSCFLDLSNEILVNIYRYLSSSDILYSFYTLDLNLDHTKIRLGSMKLNQFNSILKLFSDSKYFLRPSSLTLNNEGISCLIDRFYHEFDSNTIRSIFNHLKCLILIDCTSKDLQLLDSYHSNLTQLQSLEIINRKIDEDKYLSCVCSSYSSIIRLLFEKPINSLEKLRIQRLNGISLYQSLTPNIHLIYINIHLQTIDDLFILLNGLLPNIQIMIVRLCQKRLLKYRHFQSEISSLQLNEFTLLESSIGLISDDIKWILGFMPNLNKLTLSIRNTNDPLFCHGPNFESILTQFLPNLQQFDYRMTHQITENTIIENFIRWPMSIVNYEKYVHIYSLPWPSTKDDQRDLKDESIKSDVPISRYMRDVIITKFEEFSELERQYPRVRQLTTCLSIDIELPQRISKLILGEETTECLINSRIQSSIRYLIVKRRLNDIGQISNYARQFPNVKYLELLFPIDKSLFLNSLKNLFSIDHKQNKRCYWSELIHFSTSIVYEQFESIYHHRNLHLWFINNTDLKYIPYPFYVNRSPSLVSIWF